MTTTDANRHPSINFEETELRLGLPGGRGVDKADTAAAEVLKSRSNGKRGFSETEIVDLKLHLSSSSTAGIDEKEKVVKPPAKAQVVGWPPVRSFRNKAMATQKANAESATGKADGSNGTTTTTTTTSAAALVKVSMDGAPYLRKVDLKTYKSYQELSNALVTMFSSFTSDKKDSISHNKSTDSRNGSDFVPTYEDKDGDWMLVGDVPWEMFVESCKRMRIMTSGSEALHS